MYIQWDYKIVLIFLMQVENYKNNNNQTWIIL